MNSMSPTYSDGKLLIDSFQKAIEKGISSFNTDISHIFGSYISYERGREMCKEHLGAMGIRDSDIEKQLKGIPATNFLLISLADKIPSGAKIDGLVKITYYGVYFPSPNSRSEIYARYCPEIHSYLLSFSQLVITDIFKETDRMSYFLYFLKNRYTILKSSGIEKNIKQIDRQNSNKLIGDPENIDIHKKDTENPLLHYLTGESLDEICGFNVRTFLIKIFGLLPEDIGQWTHVFFHDSGIYYRTKDSPDIQFIQANKKYISHFEIENTAREFISNTQGGITRRKDLISYEISIQNIVDDILNANYSNIVTKHIDTSSPVDVFILEMKDNFGVPIYVENLIRFPELHDSEKLNHLVQIFIDIAPVIRNYFQNGIFFGKNSSCHPDASLSDIGIAFKRNQSEFLSPTFMKQYFIGGKNPDGTLKHSDIYVHESEYLEKYEQYYPFFLYLFFGRVFKKLLSLAKENSTYKEILENIYILTQGQISGELQSLARNGFNTKSELAKNTVLINYFMRYSCAYIMEKKGKPLKVIIPEGWKIFLRDKIFFDYERIS